MSGGNFAPLVLRRLLSLFGQSRYDELRYYMSIRASASAACSRNLGDQPNERQIHPPLSRQHGSMAEAVTAPAVYYHGAYTLAAEGSSFAMSNYSFDDYFASFTQPSQRELSHLQASHTTRTILEPERRAEASLPAGLSVTGISFPPSLSDGYEAYLDKLRQGKFPLHLKPSYEEYSRALMMEMDFSNTSREIARRLVGSALRRGAIDEVKGSQDLLSRWTEEMTASLVNDKVRVLEALNSSSTSISSLDYQSSYYTLLHTLRPRRLAEITAETVCRRIGSSKGGGSRYTSLAASVGDELLHHLRYQQLCSELSEVRKARRATRKEIDKKLEQAYSERIDLARSEYQEHKQSIQRLRSLLGRMQSKEYGASRRSMLAAVDRMTGLGGWDVKESIRIGGELIKSLVGSATVGTEKCPAFYHQVVKESNALDVGSGSDSSTTMAPSAGTTSSHCVGMIQMGEHAYSIFTRGEYSHLDDQTLPMLVPPLPWHEPMSGGHLSVKRSMARVMDKHHVEAIEAAHQRGELSRVYDALTALGQVPWKVNVKVLDILETLLASSSSSTASGKEGYRQEEAAISDIEFKLSGIKSAVSKWKSKKTPAILSEQQQQAMHHKPHLIKLAHSVGVPVDPSPIHTAEEISWTSTPSLRLSHELLLKRESMGGQLLVSSGPPMRFEARKLREQRAANKKYQMELLSMKSAFLLKLEVARQLKEAPRFYLPHNLDFRGRAYPIHPHLHHMADDIARGLLTFAEPKRLGKNGMGWMMVHVANLYGHGEDKKTLSERIAFSEGRMSEILASAEAPLFCESPFWAKGEKPWELLAACLEIKKAKDYEAQGHPMETFLSSLPVHLDGSCNGLQHYAALGKDAACAAAVNLLPNPTERPRDVYSAVASAVQRKAVKDASSANQRVSEAAKLLERNGGVVDRKLVKQTVMTVVYGVTLFGAKEQISNRLRERGWTNEQEIFGISWYLAKSVFDCIDEVFKNANETKEWLAQCAREVAGTGQVVKWTSPMGFPVHQPYVKKTAKKIKTSLQTATIQIEEPLPPGSLRLVDKKAQTSAFPPNYVHSLDSSHMMMTAIECQKQGVTFAGVHDSFWTHAGSVDHLGILLRHAFVDLHSRPLLKQLLSELQEQMKEQGKLPALPKMGSLDVREVLRAEYFFS